MKFSTLIISILFLLPTSLMAAEGNVQNTSTAPEAPQFVSLTSRVVVDTNVVRLGDIFQGVSDHAESVVAYAPRPGGRAMFDAQWLRRVANGYKLNWRPTSKMDILVVERSSRIINRDAIEALLHTSMIDQGGDQNSRAVLSNRAMVLHLPIDTTEPLAVQQLSIDHSNGRFNAILSWGMAADERTRLSGRFVRMTEVPVMADRVMRGELISQSNIKWVTMPESRLSRMVITDQDMLVGMTAKRALQPGKTISANDVRRPLLVNRGESVTMILTTPSMQLTAKGRALESGSDGDTIRISNQQSKTVIDAVVTGSGLVRVDMNVNLAMR
jgi:flagella basal body P-ring formation protein FlgA